MAGTLRGRSLTCFTCSGVHCHSDSRLSKSEEEGAEEGREDADAADDFEHTGAAVCGISDEWASASASGSSSAEGSPDADVLSVEAQASWLIQRIWLHPSRFSADGVPRGCCRDRCLRPGPFPFA